MAWMVERAGELISSLQLGPDGRKAYERARALGERLHYRTGKLDNIRQCCLYVFAHGCESNSCAPQLAEWRSRVRIPTRCPTPWSSFGARGVRVLVSFIVVAVGTRSTFHRHSREHHHVSHVHVFSPRTSAMRLRFSVAVLAATFRVSCGRPL